MNSPLKSLPNCKLEGKGSHLTKYIRVELLSDLCRHPPKSFERSTFRCRRFACRADLDVRILFSRYLQVATVSLSGNKVDLRDPKQQLQESMIDTCTITCKIRTHLNSLASDVLASSLFFMTLAHAISKSS